MNMDLTEYLVTDYTAGDYDIIDANQFVTGPYVLPPYQTNWRGSSGTEWLLPWSSINPRSWNNMNLFFSTVWWTWRNFCYQILHWAIIRRAILMSLMPTGLSTDMLFRCTRQIKEEVPAQSDRKVLDCVMLLIFFFFFDSTKKRPLKTWENQVL